MLMSPLLPLSQDSLEAAAQENGGKKRKQQNTAFLRSVFPVSQEGFPLSSLCADARFQILSYVSLAWRILEEKKKINSPSVQ